MKRGAPSLTTSLLVALSLIAAAGGASAGTVAGTVVDSYTHQALFAADVVIVGTGLGGIVDRDGRFTVEGVPEGEYQVQITMMGYETGTEDGVSVLPNCVTTVDFELAPVVLDIGLEVTVAADHFETEPDRPTSHRTLTRQEVKRAPGSMEDMYRVLQTMPGVSTVNMNTSDIVVRGGDPIENRTLLENIEIPSPLHFGRPGGRIGGVSIVHPDLIESADFMTGGFPARYGDRMSSVFEMNLKDGNSSRVNTDVNLNMAGFSVVVDGPVSGGGTMICSVRRGVFDFVSSAAGIDVLPAYWDVVGKVNYDLGRSDNLSIVGLYYPDDLDLGADPGGDTRKGEWSELNLERRDRGGAVGVNWRHMFGDRGYVLTTLARATNSWITRRWPSEGPALVGDDIWEEEIRFKSDLNYRLSDHVRLRTGIFAERIDSTYTAWGVTDTTVTGYVIPGYEMDYDPPTTYKAGSYVQATVLPFKRLSVTGGLRLDYYELTEESNVSPRLGAVLSLTDRTSINAAYGHYYQTAAPYQVAQHSSNVMLRSSCSTHQVVGLSHRLTDDTELTVEAYRKDLESGFLHNYATREITNARSGVSRGIEFGLQKRMGKRLVGSIAYTYSTVELEDGDGQGLYYSEFDRPHNLSVVGSYRISDKWHIGAKFHYASGVPYTPVTDAEQRDGGWYVIRGERHSSRYPDYHMLDVRVDRTFKLGRTTLMAYLDIWNVYGQRNVTFYGFEVDENGTVTRLAMDDGLPKALPILGLELGF